MKRAMNFLPGLVGGALTFAGATLGLPEISAAELWVCQDLMKNSPVYTDVPTQSDKVRCTGVKDSQGTFNKVPAEFFYQLGRPDLMLPRVENQTKKFISDQQAKDKTEAPELLWRSQEIKFEKKGRRSVKLDEPICELQGSVRGGPKRAAFVRVTRGALTASSVPVFLKGGSSVVNWKATLRGACRKPQVEISYTG